VLLEIVFALMVGLSFGAVLVLAFTAVGQSRKIDRLERDLRSVRKRVMFVEDRTVLQIREVVR
jgi:hypothetical protein